MRAWRLVPELHLQCLACTWEWPSAEIGQEPRPEAGRRQLPCHAGPGPAFSSYSSFLKPEMTPCPTSPGMGGGSAEEEVAEHWVI